MTTEAQTGLGGHLELASKWNDLRDRMALGDCLPVNSPAPPWPFWKSCVLVVAISMTFATLAVILPLGRATIVVVTGGIVFAVVAQRNPAFWLRRLAFTSLNAAVFTAALPTISASLDLGARISLRLQNEGAGWFVLGFLITAIVLAGLEVWREKQAISAPAAIGTEHTRGRIQGKNLKAQGNLEATNKDGGDIDIKGATSKGDMKLIIESRGRTADPKA